MTVGSEDFFSAAHLSFINLLYKRYSGLFVVQNSALRRNIRSELCVIHSVCAPFDAAKSHTDNIFIGLEVYSHATECRYGVRLHREDVRKRHDLCFCCGGL